MCLASTGSLRSLLLFAAAAVSAGGQAAEPPPAAGTLDLPNGRLAGELAVAAAGGGDGGGRDTLLWRAAGFAAPFEFRLDAIRAARFRPAGGRPEGPWRIQFVGGDALGGDVEAFDGRRVTLRRAGPPQQRLSIDRAAIARIMRVGAEAAGGFVGPGGLVGWTQTPADSWSEEAAEIRAGVRGAAVERDVGGPARAVYDVVLTWRRSPSCRLAVAATEQGRDDPYRIEVFSDEGEEDGKPQGVSMALVREEDDQASSEPVLDWADGPGPRPRRLRVVLFVDQVRGRLAVVLPQRGPEPAADVTIPPPPGRQRSGRFRLVGGGDIGLESLRVTEWRGDRPVVERATSMAVVRGDGTREQGELAPWTADDAGFVVRGEAGERRIVRDDVREIVFPEVEAPATAPTGIRVVGRGDEVICGDLLRVDADGLWLRRPGIEEPVAVPLAGLVAVESRRPAAVRPPAGRLGRLHRDGTSVRGAVVTAGGRMGFQPEGSLTGSPFVGGREAGGVVTYVERPAAAGAVEVGGIGGQVEQDDEGGFVIAMLQPDGAAAADGRIQPGDRILAIAPEEGSPFVETAGRDTATVMNLLRGKVGAPVRLRVVTPGGRPGEVDLVRRPLNITDPDILQAALAEHVRLAPGRRPGRGGGQFPAVLLLRTGDAVPCAVDAIDAAGVRIRTSLAGGARAAPVTVPAELVQAVELVPVASRNVERQRLERLLTVPRMQRAHPPTHVVRLLDGDYLRGRVEQLDAAGLTLQLVDAVKTLPRDTVARVIWLHPQDREAGADRPPPAASDPAGPLVQGVNAAGERLTIEATGVEGSLIRGLNPAIGAAAIDVDAVDRLLIGAAIAAEAVDLPYGKWKLRPAAEPRALRQPAAANENEG